MKITDTFDNYCFPIDLTFDVTKLHDSITILFERLGISSQFFHDELLKMPATTFNLTHLPTLKGNDRWQKYRGDHGAIEKAGVNEADFVEFLSEINGLYIKEVIDNVLNSHFTKFSTKFQGRCQLLWSRPKHTYKLHRDTHTAHRYHLPLATDEDCVWVFEKQRRDMILCHMPADGRIWYLNPRDVKHTVAHMGTNYRWHILLTSNS